MDQKEMIERLKRDPAALQSLMQSPDGQQLMRLLSGNDGGASLQQAASQASGGNTGAMVQMIQNVMRSPGGAALIQRIHDSIAK